MTLWHGYIGIEDLGLTAQQRQTLRAAFEGLGALNTSPYPNERNHWRPSLDGSKVIFEAMFNASNLTISKVKMFLGNTFGVDPSLIDDSTSWQVFATLETPVVTFSYLAVDYLRFALFGGLFATLTESRTEVKTYMATNIVEWEGVE